MTEEGTPRRGRCGGGRPGNLGAKSTSRGGGHEQEGGAGGNEFGGWGPHCIA